MIDLKCKYFGVQKIITVLRLKKLRKKVFSSGIPTVNRPVMTTDRLRAILDDSATNKEDLDRTKLRKNASSGRTGFCFEHS